MRIFITDKETTKATLTTTLFRKPADISAGLERLRALNPQIEDFQKLPAGTVLILPDTPDIKAGAGTTVGGDNVSNLSDALGSGLKTVNSRFTTRVDDLKTDRAAVVAALKTAAVKRLVESTPALQKQLDAADAEFKRAQKLATETQSQLAEIQKVALAEFARLQGLLGQ